ncbi:hypothetical protein D5F01_LYC08117 [Larimichthys crocea]|uniref:Uncharacterized protein n=1 Tax=Larimichthys crocea TaxID=215358 RepID=A0A6G0INT2_LARCR|nr:hypothetical protein D5F01_LYC08117 [Larimichthys crocea]
MIYSEFCITQKEGNIMGLDLFLALGFAVTDARGLHVLQVTVSWPDRYPQLFKRLGRMSGFVHQLIADLSVRPVIQPLQHIPLVLCDVLEAELHRLVEEDVIEPVDALPWVSNLVIAKRKGDWQGVTLNAEKCIFGVEEVEFLGFRLSKEGIAPIMSHTEATLFLLDAIPVVLLPGDGCLLSQVHAALL